jgi:hypothetical protein
MPERPKPTAPLIIDTCSGKSGQAWLIENFHHGLEETPALKQFYPHLDFDELVAFTAHSWERRKEKYEQFFRFLERLPSAYQIFSEIYRIGFAKLNYNKQISSAQQAKHEKLNPFRGRNLEERLNEVKPAAVEQLIKQLQEKPCEYVFDCQYHDRKMARGGDNYKLEPMSFHNAYPKKGRIVPAYAAEIGRIMSKYPQEYHFPVPKETPAPAPIPIAVPTIITPPTTSSSSTPTGQLSLF